MMLRTPSFALFEMDFYPFRTSKSTSLSASWLTRFHSTALIQASASQFGSPLFLSCVGYSPSRHSSLLLFPSPSLQLILNRQSMHTGCGGSYFETPALWKMSELPKLEFTQRENVVYLHPSPP